MTAQELREIANKALSEKSDKKEDKVASITRQAHEMAELGKFSLLVLDLDEETCEVLRSRGFSVYVLDEGFEIDWRRENVYRPVGTIRAHFWLSR